MKRHLLAALAGSALFVAATFACKPITRSLREAEMHYLPDEQDFFSLFSQKLRNSGLYVFPGRFVDETGELREGFYITDPPSGYLVYWRPPFRGDPLAPRRESVVVVLAKTFAWCGLILLTALSASVIVSYTASSFRRRVLVASLVVLFGSLSFGVPRWSRLNLPATYEIAVLIEQFGGWLLAGLAIAELAPVIPSSGPTTAHLKSEQANTPPLDS